MQKMCPTCNGSRRVRREISRPWWQVLLLRPAAVDESCRECGGTGVIKGSPEQEAKERQAAEEKARRQAAAGRKPAGAPRSATPGDVRVRELAGQFDNPDEGVRLKAAIDLSRCTGDAAVSALVRGLKDSSPKVRGCSAESLRMLRNPAAVDALVEVLMNDPQHDPVYYATKALGALATPKAIEGMISALKQRKGDISELALQLGEVRAIGAVEALLDALGDNDRERVSAYARRHAVMALQKIGDRRAVPALRSALNDGDAGVRERAQRALEALGA